MAITSWLTRNLEERYGMPLDQILITEFAIRGSLTQVASELDVSYQTVRKWCDEYNLQIVTSLEKIEE